MNFKTHLAAAIAAALAITAHAAPRWDDKALATARTKAEADIDQYLQKGSGPVAKLANDDIRAWLASAKYSKVKKRRARHQNLCPPAKPRRTAWQTHRTQQ